MYGIAFNIANRKSLLNIPAASGAFIWVMNRVRHFKDFSADGEDFSYCENRTQFRSSLEERA
jgi:hypothetical protein